MSQWQREIAAAMEAARCAAGIALAMQAGITAEAKSDGSPVTAADKKCEAAIAATLRELFPGDGLLGEEGTRAESRNGRRWIIDPIDGTRDYLRGNALWANLIGLEEDGEIVAGVVNLPALGEMYYASKGGGAFRNEARIAVSDKTSFSDSVLCLNGLNRMDEIPFRANLLARMGEFWSVRCLGGARDAMLVASGRAELWIEPHAAPWDLAPLKIVVEEAGGRFWNYDGGSTIYAGHCIACAPGLESEVRKLIELR